MAKAPTIAAVEPHEPSEGLADMFVSSVFVALTSWPSGHDTDSNGSIERYELNPRAPGAAHTPCSWGSPEYDSSSSPVNVSPCRVQ